MMQLTRILCPVDFSEFSVRALDHAAAIARWYGGQVTALHVFARPAHIPAALLDPDAPTLTAEHRSQLMSELRAITRPLQDHGGAVELAIAEGDVVDAIQDAAGALSADLVVMGTHGRRGYTRLLLGSVTERILRGVACPVLTVPRVVGGAARPPVEWKTIVCPVDFSPASLAAFEYALSLAQQADARLILLHVVEWFLDEAAVSGAYPEFARYYRALREEALGRLRALVPEDARNWCCAEEVIAGGKPYEQILVTARETDASVIVMGAQGRSGVGLALFGSTTHHVIRAATCPVLSVRPPSSPDAC